MAEFEGPTIIPPWARGIPQGVSFDEALKAAIQTGRDLEQIIPVLEQMGYNPNEYFQPKLFNAEQPSRPLPVYDPDLH